MGPTTHSIIITTHWSSGHPTALLTSSKVCKYALATSPRTIFCLQMVHHTWPSFLLSPPPPAGGQLPHCCAFGRARAVTSLSSRVCCCSGRFHITLWLSLACWHPGNQGLRSTRKVACILHQLPCSPFHHLCDGPKVSKAGAHFTLK